MSKERSAGAAPSFVISLMVNEVVWGLMVFALVVGPIALALGLLNVQDRRRDRAVAVGLGVCDASVRSLVAIRVQAPLFSHRTVVVLDMSDCADDVWPTMRRLADVLPPDIALAIEMRLDGGLPISISLNRPLGIRLPVACLRAPSA